MCLYPLCSGVGVASPATRRPFMSGYRQIDYLGDQLFYLSNTAAKKRGQVPLNLYVEPAPLWWQLRCK